MTTTTFSRPISPTERLYLAAQPLTAPFAIQLVVSGRGSVDRDALVCASEAAGSACPGARLVRRGDRWVDGGLAPAVREIHGATVDFALLDDDAALTGEITPEGATCEILLFSGDPVTIVFRAFHGVMDAKGLEIWAGEVFRALRGEQPRPALDPTTDHDLVRRVGAPGKPTRLLPTFRSPVRRSAAGRGERRFTWRHRVIPATTPAVVARISAVVADATGARARIMVPVDLRRHDPAVRSTANLALPQFLDVRPGQTWSQINAQLITRMVGATELNEMDNGGLAKLPAGITRTVLRGINAVGTRGGRNLTTAIVSHAGKFQLVELSAPGFSADRVAALPVHTSMVPISFVITEVDGRTELTASIRGGSKAVARAEALIDRIAEELGGPTESNCAAEETFEDRPVDAIFAEQVRRTPDAPAVIARDETLTYAELNSRADAVAVELRSRGVRHGDIVAIMAGRSVDAMVAQTAVLKAGAAFLALDPRHPRERVATVLRDAAPRLCLIEPEYADNIDESDCDAVLFDVLPREISGEEVHSGGTSRDVAYVTYTSGSTGTPKGVQVTHGGITNFLGSACDWYRLGAETRYAHYHTPAADMACAAYFLPLLSGGAVVLISDEINHVTLRSMFCESSANTFLLTPSLAEVVVRTGLDVTDARTVILGGEQLHGSLAARLREFFGATCRLVNSYGPAEMSIVCVSQVIDDELIDPEAPVPIGRPCANTPVHVLDEVGQQVAPGEVGELYFGGPQVGRGYLGRADLTASKFVQLPTGGRGYRTGDLGRQRADDVLEFVGRIDEQVKVRGNRVEPGEVRVALERCPGVQRAAVVTRRDPQRHTNALVGYVIADGDHADGDPADGKPANGKPADGDQLTADRVRGFLVELVPTYMIPAEIHVVDEIPLNANGKIDTARLSGVHAAASATNAAASDAGASQAESPEPDSSTTEDGDVLPSAVSQIWADVLKVDARSLNDDSDFYLLGGDSLAAVEMLARVSKTVVGAAGEQAFVAGLEGLAHEMTLGRVCVAVRSAAAPAESTAGATR